MEFCHLEKHLLALSNVLPLPYLVLSLWHVLTIEALPIVKVQPRSSVMRNKVKRVRFLNLNKF